jgi:hypothetical protein
MILPGAVAMISKFILWTMPIVNRMCWIVCFALGLGVLPGASFDRAKFAVVLAAPEPNFDDSPATVTILRALNKPTHVEWHERPLPDCIQYLGEYHGITVRLDEDALNAAQISLDLPATLTLQGISLRSVLRLLLEPLALDYVVDEGEIVVTTRAIAGEHLHEFMYQLGGVVRSGIPLASLIDAITQTIDRPSWKVNGGKGAMRSEQQTLHVRQRMDVQVHLQVLLRELLQKIDGVSAADIEGRLETNEYRIADLQNKGISDSDILKWLTEFLLVESSAENGDKRPASIKENTLILTQPAATQDAVSEFFHWIDFLNKNPDYQPRRESFEYAASMLSFDAKRRIASKRMAKPISFDFRDLTREDTFLYIRESTNFNIYVNWGAIERAGIDLNARCTLKADKMQLENVIDQLFEPHKLDWYLPEPDLFVVTSRSAAAARMEPRVYRTERILAAGQTQEGIVKQLMTTIEPASWSANGGPGTVRPLHNLLIVDHNRRVHEQISRVLEIDRTK